MTTNRLAQLLQSACATYLAEYPITSAPPAPSPVPTPSPTPTPTPAPVPVPAPSGDYVAQSIFGTVLALGWFNYSPASTQITSEGGPALQVDLSGWKDFNLHNSVPMKLEDYWGIAFTVKELTPGGQFRAALFDGNSQIGTGKIIAPAATSVDLVLSMADLGAPLFGSFTNFLAQGQTAATMSPFVFSNVRLLKRTTPIALPPAPPMTAAPTTAGWLTIDAQGKFHDEAGVQWVGRGVNIPDFKLFNAGAGLALDVASKELKRRVTFAKTELGIDFVRFCVHQDAGVQVAGDPWWVAVKEFVTWCWTQYQIRVLFSFWREGTLKTLTQAPTAASIPAWQMVCKAFANSGHVIFAFSNEPQAEAAGDWDAFNNTCKAIRDQEAQLGAKAHVIAVQGLSGWARNIAAYANRRITASGPIAYEGHFYDHRGDFKARFVDLAKSGMPIICGEWGPAVIQANTSASNYNNLNLGDNLYWSTPAEQPELYQLMHDNGIPCCAWALSIRAWPDLLVDNSQGKAGVDMTLELTDWGKMLKSLYTAP